MCDNKHNETVWVIPCQLNTKKLTQSNFHGSWVIDVESIEILIHTKF